MTVTQLIAGPETPPWRSCFGRKVLLAGGSLMAVLIVLNVIASLPREAVVKLLTEPLGGENAKVADSGAQAPEPAADDMPTASTTPAAEDKQKTDDPAVPLPKLSGGSQARNPEDAAATEQQTINTTMPDMTRQASDEPVIDHADPALQPLTVVIGTPVKPDIEDHKTDGKPAESAEAPPADTPFSPTAGKVVADGLAPPLLRITNLDPDRIMALVAAGKAVVVAREASRDIYYLDPAGTFRPANDLDTAHIGQRFLMLDSQVSLTTPWDMQLAGLVSSRRFSFALRFTASFDAALLADQFKALSEHGIDLAAANRDRRTVITTAEFTNGLQPLITSVIIDPEAQR